jgi:hypothetical protein
MVSVLSNTLRAVPPAQTWPLKTARQENLAVLYASTGDGGSARLIHGNAARWEDGKDSTPWLSPGDRRSPLARNVDDA